MPGLRQALLASDEPAAVEVERADGGSPFFIVCDHAGARIPRVLGTLGLTLADLRRHIAWDIGAAGVARRLSAMLDACAVLQTYSRLVIDCNRPPGVEGSIAAISEATPIPGNQAIVASERERREREVFRPYHDRIRALLDARKAAGRATVLVSVHSFTPIYLGRSRPWHVGILYNRDTRLARAMLVELRSDPDLIVGDNEPYAVSDFGDYAIPVYGEKRRLPHVEIEIRQDLIGDRYGQELWARRLADRLTAAMLGIDLSDGRARLAAPRSGVQMHRRPVLVHQLDAVDAPGASRGVSDLMHQPHQYQRICFFSGAIIRLDAKVQHDDPVAREPHKHGDAARPPVRRHCEQTLEPFDRADANPEHAAALADLRHAVDINRLEDAAANAVLILIEEQQLLQGAALVRRELRRDPNGVDQRDPPRRGWRTAIIILSFCSDDISYSARRLKTLPWVANWGCAACCDAVGPVPTSLNFKEPHGCQQPIPTARRKNATSSSLASEIVELIVVTNDESFLRTLRTEIGGARRIWHAPSADTVGDLLHAGQVGILVLDGPAVPGALAPFIAEISRQFPGLVMMIAGGRDTEAQVAELISDGTAYRFMHKPLSPGRAKLFADAAVKKLDEQRRFAAAQPSAHDTSPSRRTWLIGASAAFALTLTAGAFVIQGPTWRNQQARGADIVPGAAPIESPLLARAAAALAANRLTAPAGDNALELYLRALAASPMNDTARAGLAEIRDRLFDAAQDAVLEDRLDDAAAAIEAARRAGVESGRIALLSAELAKSRQQIGAIEAGSNARIAPAAAP